MDKRDYTLLQHKKDILYLIFYKAVVSASHVIGRVEARERSAAGRRERFLGSFFVVPLFLTL
jgi:hypothetical protein